MELLAELLQIIAFFVAFKYKGLIFATVIAILFALVKLILFRINNGKYHMLQLTSFCSLLILGGISLICKKEIFIKWKLTVIYWILAITFLITHIYSKKSIIEKINSTNGLELPKRVCDLLSIAWTLFFALMGGINLYIVYYYDTNTWVNFKLFGTLGLMLLFFILQGIYIYISLQKYKSDINIK